MDTTVYSNDRRVEVVHPTASTAGANGTKLRNNNRDSDWILHIHQAHPSDSGIYECQINTEPKKSKAYHLHIVGKFEFLAFPSFFDGHIEFRFVPVYLFIRLFFPFFFHCVQFFCAKLVGKGEINSSRSNTAEYFQISLTGL